eukprot:scpid38571/ scgid13373/ GRB2-associated-binding protein 2; GRB2-associated binder 2; Growth factor receptor bound protein 2-associated protein 2; pp100
MGGGRIVKEGFLTKSPPTDDNGQPALLKQWKRRYFRLYESKVLEYYENDKPSTLGKSPKGSVNLEDCFIMQENYTNHPMRISLSTKKRTYFMDAESHVDYEAWVRALAEIGGFAVDENATTAAEDELTASCESASSKPKGSIFRRMGTRKMQRKGSQSTLRRQASSVSSSVASAEWTDLGDVVLPSEACDASTASSESSRESAASSSSEGRGSSGSPSPVGGQRSRAGSSEGKPGEASVSAEEKPYSMTAVNNQPEKIEEKEEDDDLASAAAASWTGEQLGTSRPRSCSEALKDLDRQKRCSQNFGGGALFSEAQPAASSVACRPVGADEPSSNYTMVPSNLPMSSSVEARQNYTLMPCNVPLSASAEQRENYSMVPTNVPASASAYAARENYTMVPCNRPARPGTSAPETHMNASFRAESSSSQTRGLASDSGMCKATSAERDEQSQLSGCSREYDQESSSKPTGDSGVSVGVYAFGRSTSGDNSMNVTPSPPKRSPPMQRPGSADEGIITDGIAGMQFGSDITCPNPAMYSSTPPIPIPPKGGRDERRMPSLPQENTTSPVPPLPAKPKACSPAPGQPYQTQGYATLTADDLKVDRSTKPTHFSPTDPAAPAIDRSAKPRAPIHATIVPEAAPQFVPTTVSPQGRQLCVRGSGGAPTPMYDKFGNAIVIPFGAQVSMSPMVAQQEAMHYHPTANYASPPPPIPARVGNPDQPYSIPPPFRALPEPSSVMYVPGHEQAGVPRRVSADSVHLARGSYEQVPTNRPMMASSYASGGGMSRSSRGSMSSRVSAGSLSNASVASVRRSMSLSEYNDGGDYVFSPLGQRQSSGGPPEDVALDEDYEPMNPGGVFATAQQQQQQQ